MDCLVSKSIALGKILANINFSLPSPDNHRFFGYLWRVTGEEQTAYDLSQETFVRAWQHFRTIKSYERPDAWLLREVAAIPGEDEEFERCPQ